MKKSSRFQFSFKKKVNLGFFASILIVIFYSSYAIYISHKLENAKKLNLKTYEVTEKLYDLISTTKDLEIHRKDYSISEKAFYLEAYYHALVKIQRELNLLYSDPFFRDKDSQRLRFINVIQTISKTLDCSIECKYDPQKKVFIHDIVKEHFRTTEIEIFSQDLRNLIYEIVNQERETLNEKQEQEEKFAYFVNLFIVLGGSSIAFIFVLLIYFINKDIRNDRLQLARLQNLSITDELTGLRNRRGFIHEAKNKFQEAIQNRKKLFLYFIDMDGLKAINDTLGHEYGDKAIKALSEILKQSFRISDVIGRLGGDEFAVIMADEHVSPSIIYQRLQKKISEYNATSKEPFKLAVSIGHKEFNPANPMSIEEMLREADKKMYQQKQERKTQRKE